MGFAGQIETSGGAISPIGSTLYGVCSTAASTAAKVVTLADYDELIIGTTVHVKFLNGNTAANASLEVGGTAAKPIYLYGTTAPGTTAATSWAANSMVSFTYDGTAWRMNDSGANGAMVTMLEGEISTEAANRATAVTGAVTQIVAAYDSTATYTVGQLCIHDDKLYRCITPITTPEAWTSGHWAATTLVGETGIILKFLDTVVGDPSTASATVSGSITSATVDVATFESILGTTGEYVFTFDGFDWYYNGNIVVLSNYGITYEGTPASADTITVDYYAGACPFKPMPIPTYATYPFRAIVPLSGVTASMVPEVIFGLEEAILGAYAPIAETYNGGVYLYATNAPAASFTIPVIFCRG